MSSSHLCLGLPALLLVLVVGLSPGFRLAAFFVHLASECDAILIANLHFIFLWISIQHGMLATRILSSTSRVIVLMYSIQSSSSLSAVSTSSSGSLWKHALLSLIASDARAVFFVGNGWRCVSASSVVCQILFFASFFFFLHLRLV